MRFKLIPMILLALTASGLSVQRIRENEPERVVGHPPKLKETSRIKASFSGLQSLIQQIQANAQWRSFAVYQEKDLPPKSLIRQMIRWWLNVTVRISI